jgi:hypothetical protein
MKMRVSIEIFLQQIVLACVFRQKFRHMNFIYSKVWKQNSTYPKWPGQILGLKLYFSEEAGRGG